MQRDSMSVDNHTPILSRNGLHYWVFVAPSADDARDGAGTEIYLMRTEEEVREWIAHELTGDDTIVNRAGLLTRNRRHVEASPTLHEALELVEVHTRTQAHIMQGGVPIHGDTVDPYEHYAWHPREYTEEETRRAEQHAEDQEERRELLERIAHQSRSPLDARERAQALAPERMHPPFGYGHRDAEVFARHFRPRRDPVLERIARESTSANEARYRAAEELADFPVDAHERHYFDTLEAQPVGET